MPTSSPSKTKKKADMVVDLTASPDASAANKAKKPLKQMRLPFAPLNKTLTPAPTSTQVKESSSSPAPVGKRKRDSEGETTPNKVSKEDKEGVKEEPTEEKKTPRRIVPTFVGKRDQEGAKTPTSSSTSTPPSASASAAAAKKRIVPIPVFSPKPAAVSDDSSVSGGGGDDVKPDVKPEHAESEAKPASKPEDKPEIKLTPDRLQKVKVAIAKLSVSIMELDDEMKTAAEERDFLKAAELKDKSDEKKKSKEELQAAVDNGDYGVVEDALRKMDEAKRLETPPPTQQVNDRKRPAAESPESSGAKVKTPVSSKAKTVKTPGSSGSKPPRGTPKSADTKKAEALKKKEERELEREKAKKQKEAEKAEKERLKEAEKMEREQAKKEKEAEKEQAKKEKEAEKEQAKREKEAEKAEKERLKDEEKRAKEEEKRKQEELEKQKKEKLAKTFTNFFIKKDPSKVATGAAQSLAPQADTKSEATLLNQFRVKKDMRLAPTVRRATVDKDEFDRAVNNDGAKLYVERLKDADYKVGKSGRTWPAEERKKEDDDEVEVIEEEDDEEDLGEELETSQVLLQQNSSSGRVRAKLLQFCENQRPPYFGTWTKKSPWVGARKPFGKDQVLFDYEYDSDDDWEEEEQGESLSDEEKDKEEDEEPAGEEDDDDDGFFVGHGVLDKDELHPEEDEEEEEEGVKGAAATGSFYDEELEEKKQKLRAMEFEEQYKKRRPVKLKPRVFGCMWIDNDRSDIVYEQLIRILKPCRAVSLIGSGNPIPTTLSSPQASPSVASTPTSKSSGLTTPSGVSDASSTPRARKLFPEESVPDLVRLVHCNTNNKGFIAREFAEFLVKKLKTSSETPVTITGTPSTGSGGDQCDVSKNRILDKIAEVADYKRFEEAGSMFNKTCWVVKRDILEKLDMVNTIKVPNDWTYNLEQPKKADLNRSGSSAATATPTGSGATTASLGTPKTPGVATGITPKRRPSSSTKKREEEYKGGKKKVSIQDLIQGMKKKESGGSQQQQPSSPPPPSQS